MTAEMAVSVLGHCHLGATVLQHESLSALRMGGREDDGRDASQVGAHDRRPGRIDLVEDHQHVFVGLLEEGHVKRAIAHLERIRSAGAAFVEQDESAV